MQGIDRLVEWLQSHNERIDLEQLKARLDGDSMSAGLAPHAGGGV